MDRIRYDTLVRRVFTGARRSRRAALAAVVGATLVRHDASPTRGKKATDHGGARTSATTADACFPNTACVPGRGKNTSRCDFSNATVFRNKDVRGSNLSHSNFFGADLRGADFRGANLSGGCFVSADLTGAKLGASVNLSGAVFCNTTMPDGTVDDRGCEGETPCCHQRLQDCPDGHIDCSEHLGDGPLAGRIGPIGYCYQFPICCPCDHPNDSVYWSGKCDAAFAVCDDLCGAFVDAPLGGQHCFG